MAPRSRSLSFAPILSLLLFVATPAVAEWVPNGNLITPGPFTEFPCALLPDGAGGVVDARPTGASINLDRWTGDGVRSDEWPPIIETPIETGSGVVSSYSPHLVADGFGGVYVLGAQVRCGHSCRILDPARLFALHYTAIGAIVADWPGSGVLLENSDGWNNALQLWDPGYIDVASDETGGLVTAWIATDQTHSHQWVRANRCGPDPVAAWGPDGMALGPSTSRQTFPNVLADGRGGAFVFWIDDRDFTSRVFGQHVSAEGQPLWTPGGREISHHRWHAITRLNCVPDGARGVLLAWTTSDSCRANVFATRVTRGGGDPWHDDATIRVAPGSVSELAVLSLDHDAIIAWRDLRFADRDAYFAQRIDHAGRVMWTAGGVSVCSAPGIRSWISIVSDGADGAYFSWLDDRLTGEAFAIRLTPNGGIATGWEQDGSPICARLGSPPLGLVLLSNLSAVADGAGNAFVFWVDARPRCEPSGNCSNFDALWFTKLTSNGPIVAPVSPSSGTIALAGSARAQRPAPAPMTLSIHSATSGRAGDALRFAITAPDATPGSLELFDVAGRRVWRTELGATDRIVVISDADIANGIYLARLTQGTHVATTRVAVVR